ncbi:MAG TPA: AI-2E family transporter [Terriglobia bacterium]|nr:AI-2E family transporter [Terriglobia bacterium]
MNVPNSQPPATPAAALRNDAARRRITIVFLTVAAAATLCVCYLIAKPFVEPILFAAVLAIVFFPLHDRIWHLLRRPNLAALVSTLAVVLMVVIPLLALARVVAGEVSAAYASVSEKSAAGGGWEAYITEELQKPIAALNRYVDLSSFDPVAEIRSGLEELSSWMVRSAGHVVRNVGTFFFDAGVCFFTLFFLFREGRRIRLAAAAALPLDLPRVEELFSRISETIIVNVYGVLAVAAVQGFLVGAALWALGIRSPILWGVITAVCSPIPFVGTALVWVPAAFILLAGGHWVKCLILLVWGGGFVTLADHALRLYIVGGRVKMNTLLVFFALVGGIKEFGILGIILGPLVFSIASALLGMLRQETRTWQLQLASGETTRGEGSGP